MKRITIEASNFGPLHEAVVELKPLTIFIGANSTGKSYVSQLVYAVAKAYEKISNYYPRPSVHLKTLRDYSISQMGSGHPFSFEEPEFVYEDSTLEQFASLLPSNWLESLMFFRERQDELTVNYGSLPKQIQQDVDNYVRRYLDSYRESLSRELERCYDARLNDLSSKVGDRESFSLVIRIESPKLELRCYLEGRELQSTHDFSFEGQEIPLARPSHFDLDAKLESDWVYHEKPQSRILRHIINHTFSQYQSKIFESLPQTSYYLPAARSGILLGQKAIARVGLRTLERAGIESIKIPKLPGSVVDFLDQIYSIDRTQLGRYSELARELEIAVMRGRVELVETKQGIPEIYYREPDLGRIGLHRASSGICELTSIIIFLRYLVQSGDMFVIEEPESHLHPAAQREVAKFIVKLVRRGVNVLLTTHSDYLVTQISNLIALSCKPKNQQQALGFSPRELISPEEVGAYGFLRPSYEHGSAVRALAIGESGIDQEEFGAVAEALYNESVEAQRRPLEALK